MTLDTKLRCSWAGPDRVCYSYHDNEWGVPLHNDRKLFELLILEQAQAGLSWITILKRRNNYRKAFDSFDPQKVAKYQSGKVKQLLADSGIIRNRLKIASSISSANAFLLIQKEFGSFDKYIWQFTSGKVKTNNWKTAEDIPANTEESTAMSNDLKRRGFSFVGPTICYAFMQAIGMVNDHLVSCYRYKEVA
jgi:DNA-3-methyladenine glycosylase I